MFLPFVVMNNHHLTSSNEKQMFIDSIMDAMAALFEKYDEKDGYTCFQYDENGEVITAISRNTINLLL